MLKSTVIIIMFPYIQKMQSPQLPWTQANHYTWITVSFDMIDVWHGHPKNFLLISIPYYTNLDHYQ